MKGKPGTAYYQAKQCYLFHNNLFIFLLLGPAVGTYIGKSTNFCLYTSPLQGYTPNLTWRAISCQFYNASPLRAGRLHKRLGFLLWRPSTRQYNPRLQTALPIVLKASGLARNIGSINYQSIEK